MDPTDVQAIERLFERFIAAFNEKDLETLRSSYTEDALVIPPGQAPIRGRDAIIERLWSPTFEAFDVDADLPTDEIQAGDEWGFVRGTYGLRLDPVDEGDPVREKGQYIDVVRKDGGGWKIARAIWNATESGAGNEHAPE